jgi:hypothetical protein
MNNKVSPVYIQRSLFVLFSIFFCPLCCLSSSIYVFWLPFGILDLRLLITLWYPRFTSSDYPIGILDLRLLITLWYLRFTASDYPIGILDLRLLITLWYLQTFLNFERARWRLLHKALCVLNYVSTISMPHVPEGRIRTDFIYKIYLFVKIAVH